ncbi:MAG: DUF2064 domain-containing protein [Motiliproteus sp.]|nr:DUF2064 domain-containing protein [Motiliproteus sp.]MCW9054252.1 DUF2064 domain-containing protein [Motiliproteus sp.]
MRSDINQQPPTLVILCKRPKLNQGKQRLAATLGAEPTVGLAKCFLNCALEDAAQWPGNVVLSPSSVEDLQWAQVLMADAQVIPQHSGNLGERLMQVDQELRRQGHQQLLFIGTDAPALSDLHYQAAIHGLQQTDVVLSAASDGGVTMMGSSQPWPDIIDLPWSTEDLGSALKSCCQQNGQQVEYIPPSYDVDVEADLRRLADDLYQDQRPARQQLLQQLLTLNLEERQLCTNR